MPGPRTRPGSGPRVLVVDDNLDACRALALLLRAHGYQVETTHDADSTPGAAAAFSPAAVVLDLHLPDGHGMDLVQRLRGEPWAEGCLFIALSGDESATEQAGHECFHHLMLKPVDFERLLERLPPTGSD